MKIAIIGTAGRKSDATKLKKETFIEMLAATKELDLGGKNSLVSGGAAWADHLAVVAFVLGWCKSLHLFFPCEWDERLVQYKDFGVFDWKSNPGGTANYYHRKFSSVVAKAKNDTLSQIQAAIERGATFSVGDGLMERNTQVAAAADMVVAFTYGPGARIADGGTRDTFVKFKKLKPDNRALHYSIAERRMYDAV